jgi:hypothetical protein
MDFVSIELQDGHVVVQLAIGGGDGGHVRLESARPYNDGVTHVITATRQRHTATLTVGTDDEVTGTLNGERTAMNIKNEPHFIGGVPPSFNRSR